MYMDHFLLCGEKLGANNTQLKTVTVHFIKQSSKHEFFSGCFISHEQYIFAILRN